MPNATVSIFLAGTQTLASLFSDDGLTPKLNPTTTDANGRFDFFVADGRYDIVVSGGNIATLKIANVEISDITDAAPSDAEWQTEVLGFADQGVNPTPPAGFVNLYAKSADKKLYFKDDTGLETAVAGATGANILPLNNVFTGTNAFDKDVAFKGLNPYVDARRYGVRAVNPNALPAVSGITATTVAGSPTVTISQASTFQNGDGVVIQNAGPASGLGVMSAPTVTPFNARGPQNSGDGVPAPAGSTTYNYLVFACDTGGGCTAASAVGSTTAGSASLGNQSQSGYSASRSNDTWTYTVGSQPAFSAGTLVDVDSATAGVTDADFVGYYKTATVTGTGFTVINAPGDTRNGARVASTGTYTAHWWNYNKVTWTAPAGSPFRYFVCSDRDTPGTFHVLGQALRPNNPKFSTYNVDPLILEFDDFGTTQMAASASTVPWYVSDANCTAPATNDNWVTTIASGAGTTTLTMAGNAPNSSGGPQTIRFDNTPNLLTAVAAAGNAPIALPLDSSGNSYVFNSVVDIATSNPTLMLPQGLVTNDTILIGGGGGGGGKWYGDRLPGKGSVPQFASQGLPQVTTKASPGIYLVLGFSTYISGLSFVGPNNGTTFMMDGGGGNLGSTFVDTQFYSGSQSIDYLGMAFFCRAVLGAGCDISFQGKTNISSGTQAMNGISSAPSFYADTGGSVTFEELMGTSRALLFTNINSVRIGHAHWQGGSTPLVALHCRLGNCFTNLTLGDADGMIMDTMGQPGMANIPGGGTLVTNAYWNTISGPSSSIPLVSGQRLTSLFQAGVQLTPPALGQNRDVSYLNSGPVIDGIFNPAGGAIVGTYQNNVYQTALSTGNNYPIFVGDTQMAAPTGSVVAGGSVPVGSHTYAVRPVWQNGGEGTLSRVSSPITTTSGNQTVNLSWTPVSGNCKGYNIQRDGQQLLGSSPSVVGCGSSSFSDTAAGVFGSFGNAYPAGGPTMLMPGTQGIATPALILGGNSLTAPAAGALAVNSGALTAGNLSKYSTSSGILVDSGVAASSLATVPLAVGNLAPGISGQCVNTSGTTAVWGSCAGTAGEQFLSVNTTAVTANASTTGFQTMQTATPIPAGALNSLGKTFRATATGPLTNVNGTETIQLGFAFGPFEAGSNAVLPVVAASYQWWLQALCTTTTTGTSGHLSCFVNVNIGSFTPSATSYVFTGSTDVPTNLVANPVNVSTQVAFSTASTSNSATSAYLLVEQLN